MEGEDPKRSDRPNKGKPPVYLVDYEVPPHVRPQNSIAAGPSVSQGNVPAAEDEAKSIKCHQSTHSMFSRMSVGAIARRNQLEAELHRKMLLADMKEQVDKAELEVRKIKLERIKEQSALLSEIEKAEIEE